MPIERHALLLGHFEDAEDLQGLAPEAPRVLHGEAIPPDLEAGGDPTPAGTGIGPLLPFEHGPLDELPRDPQDGSSRQVVVAHEPLHGEFLPSPFKGTVPVPEGGGQGLLHVEGEQIAGPAGPVVQAVADPPEEVPRRPE